MMFLIYTAKLHLIISIHRTSEILQIETSKSVIDNVATLQAPPLAACGGRNFWQIKGNGASRFTAFFSNMALVTCFVCRATRHVCDGTLGGLGRLLKRVLRLGCGSRTSLSLSCDLGGRSKRSHIAPVRLGWSIFRSESFVS